MANKKTKSLLRQVGFTGNANNWEDVFEHVFGAEMLKNGTTQITKPHWQHHYDNIVTESGDKDAYVTAQLERRLKIEPGA